MDQSTVLVAKRWIERYATSRMLRVAGGVLLLAAAAATGVARGLGLFVLIVAGGMLLIVIALLWSSLQSLTDENAMTLHEALALGRPSVQEEQKRAVLRALKDLAYERSVGKISEEDYAVLAARYRQQAKELLRTLDHDLAPYRERVEAELDQRLANEARKQRRAGKSKAKRARRAAQAEAPDEPPDAVDEPPDAVDEPPDAADDMEQEPAPEALKATAAKRPTRRCKHCETRNDLDAQFCKRCGKTLSAAGKVLCATCPALYSDELDECPECGMPREGA